MVKASLVVACILGAVVAMATIKVAVTPRAYAGKDMSRIESNWIHRHYRISRDQPLSDTQIEEGHKAFQEMAKKTRETIAARETVNLPATITTPTAEANYGKIAGIAEAFIKLLASNNIESACAYASAGAAKKIRADPRQFLYLGLAGDTVLPSGRVTTDTGAAYYRYTYAGKDIDLILTSAGNGDWEVTSSRVAH